MSDFDVSFRLRLVNDLSKEAKKAEEDLKRLDKAVDRLGRSNINTDKELRDVGKAARDAEVPVKKLTADTQKLNGVKTDRTEREIKALGTASKTTGRNVWGLEKDLKRLNSANTDAAEREVKAIGTASRNAATDVRNLDKEVRKLGGNNSKIVETEAAVGGMKTTIGAIGGVASGAMVGLLSAVALNQVIDRVGQAAAKYRDLEAAVALTQNTLEMRDPQTRQAIMKSNTQLSLRYGLDKGEVNKARDTLTAANVGLESQESLLDPILKTAKASGTTPADIAKAVIALRRNLGVTDAEVPMALDMMAKGAKIGSFELENMAKNFPELAAMYSQSGRTGTPAVAELISYLQIMLEAAGTPDEAATNLRGFLDKIFSPDAVRNFKEKGVDLAALKARADKTGASYPEMVFDELERLTKSDPMKINELFGDREAKMAIQPQLKNRARGRQVLDEVKNQSAGTIEKDWEPVRQLDATKAAQQQSAMDGMWDKIGKNANNFIMPFWERVARTVNRDYDNMRWLEELPQIEGNAKSQEAQLEAELAKLGAQQKDMGDGGVSLGPRMNRIRAELQSLQEEKAYRAEEKKRLSPEAAIDPKKAASLDQPVKAANKDMSAEAKLSISGYNAELTKGLNQAIAIAESAVAKIKASLNFTASPTISPTLVNPGSGVTTGKVPGKQSSVTSNSTTKLTQNISSPSAVRAARLAIREQNRATRMAQNRAYSDMGSMPA